MVELLEIIILFCENLSQNDAINIEFYRNKIRFCTSYTGLFRTAANIKMDHFAAMVNGFQFNIFASFFTHWSKEEMSMEK